MKRILILDDEPSITFSLSRCLKSDKVEVISCNDSSTARMALAGDGVDAIIADVRLSPSNLHESIDLIRDIRAQSSVPLIMMSGTEDLKEEAMVRGANYFLSKPLDIDALILLLHDLGLEVGQQQKAS
ncbi:MAG TPA: response regulator [Acidobacteriota bacterium]|nr:response regulator [Acidobacteriota bacterium]